MKKRKAVVSTKPMETVDLGEPVTVPDDGSIVFQAATIPGQNTDLVMLDIRMYPLPLEVATVVAEVMRVAALGYMNDMEGYEKTGPGTLQ